MEFSIVTTQIAILGLLLIACVAAIALRRLNFPYTIGLVVVGVTLGLLKETVPGVAPLTEMDLSHEIILFLFLPPLVFESALTLDARLLLRNLTPVLMLAVPGLLLSTAVVGGLMGALTPLDWTGALLFGSLISATDPVAVVALFKELGLSKQLVVLIEGESLFNDATAIVTFNLILAAATAQASNLLLSGLLEFLRAFIGGIVVGAIAAWLISYLIGLAYRNPLVQSTLSTVLAFGTFILAEHTLHISGVIAVVSAGMVTGWLTSIRLKPENRDFLHEFWEYASFLANSLIFLLVGITSVRLLQSANGLMPLLATLGIAIAAILLARVLAVFGLMALVNRLQIAPRVGRPAQAILVWGGLRGAVGLALALSLESEPVNSELIVPLTLGVALFTLMVPGTTIGQLIKQLKLDKPSVLERLERFEALIEAKQAALQSLAQFRKTSSQYQTQIDHLSAQLSQALDIEKTKLHQLKQSLSDCPQQLHQAIWLQALMIENQAYRDLHDQGLLSEAAFVRLELGLNVRYDAVIADTIPPPMLAPHTLMTQIEKTTVQSAMRLMPHERWRQQRSLTRFKQNYECDLAIVQVAERVLQRIDELSHSSQEQALRLKTCLSYYREVKEAAQSRRQRSSKQHPQDAQQIEQQIARRIAAIGQENAIADLLAEGAISEKVAQTACRLIAVRPD
ncbi:MAG: transporter [Leptolyngbya sp. SIO4C1]|nr:transporter [Leptolyngbya sp. SIO4C1]